MDNYNISKENWDKIIGYASVAYEKYKSEIGGMAVMCRYYNNDNEGRWFLERPVILKQEISAGNTIIDKEALATVICYVLKVGPLAYKDNKFGQPNTMNKPWCKKGDWILIGRYAGTRFRLEDENEVRIINDDEVIATILDPDDIKSL